MTNNSRTKSWDHATASSVGLQQMYVLTPEAAAQMSLLVSVVLLALLSYMLSRDITQKAGLKLPSMAVKETVSYITLSKLQLHSLVWEKEHSCSFLTYYTVAQYKENEKSNLTYYLFCMHQNYDQYRENFSL